MNTQWWMQQGPLIASFGLGLATAVAPCPMATNIAAISYLGRKVGNARAVFLTGLLYTLGRSLAYFLLALIIVTGLAALPGISAALQTYGHMFLGPFLVLVGMLLFGLLTIPLPSIAAGRSQAVADSAGIWGGLLLGLLFALAFCPTSAAYFGTVIAIAQGSQAPAAFLSLLFGVGTGLPVVAFAALVAFSAQSLGKAFQVMTVVDQVVRSVGGTLFIAVGIYFIVKYLFDVPLPF
ncbi:aromatic aminobenezylarsenical efflux permease ArsG family transporter [Thermopirellula anaerolimosa]